MARRMFSVDQISGSKSLELYQHNISISSFDDSMQAYMTVYSVNSSPVTTKQELVDNLLVDSSMPATGTAETNTRLIYAINSQGELLYTDMAGNQSIYSDDYIASDTVVAIGG